MLIMTIKEQIWYVKDNLKSKNVHLKLDRYFDRVMGMVRKGLAGIACFSLGGTFLMFVLHFMLKDVYVRDIWDWVSFFGWMSVFSFVGFFFFGLGIWLIIKDVKAETKPSA